MALKILMMGGLRCGKTTALASAFEQMVNGPVKDYFTVADKTDYTTKESDNGPEKQDVLSDMLLELEGRLESPTDDFFIVDRSPTYNVLTYTLRLIVPGTRNSMDIEFTDVPGNWFYYYINKPIREFHPNRISDTDVFIVVVDTPYLMYERDAIARGANSIAGIHDYLTHISDDEEKLVIFSPIKCEKWVKEGKMDEVVEKLKKMYAATITALRAFPKMSICIIPIETVGNILFFEYSEPLLLAEANSRRCKKINDSLARLSNGEIYFLKGNETFYQDTSALISGCIMRPYCWYHINPQPVTPHLYAPYNCEQIPLHIVDFMLKTLIRKYPRRIEGWIWDNGIGGIPKETLLSKLKEIRSSGLIKENVDHIEYLKRSN